MSFQCEHCGYENNEIQSAGEIQPKGCRLTLTVTTTSDLNRRVVKSDYSSIQIPEVNFEIPSQSQKGEVTTVEGIIERAITGLEQDQEQRRKDHPDVAKQIEDFVETLRSLKSVEKPFTVIIEDITGNSHIENFSAPKIDPHLKTVHIIRSKEQDQNLGIYTSEEVADKNEKDKAEEKGLLKPIDEGAWPLEELENEILQFPTNCPDCGSPCETNMKVTNIPHFKEVIIMATLCEVCGCKTNEVKSGGGIEDYGTIFELKISNREDLTRDVLKSETCCMKIPELECEVGASALGGRFTTAEGILTAMRDQIEENAFLFKDSQDEVTKNKVQKFADEISKIINLKREATLILDDPAGNSYVQSLNEDDTPDEGLIITKYTRTFDQNEELGLNDINTENYS
ncbi:unnamed protein product [Hermetia illucens]|uniref:Zinc finger ZPR1-type domain-containing protein n=2 Tax=Hermetia illucens TaxID=343691 RepID=A0A7R8V4Y0_HERIL|nr:zinc finger protein ZPR1 isoform X3 [Hermetia illucens]XP_037922480.1 zinc finger protein ZPR1 isoform X3 [Hermetia illucens]CAD7092930.1 unnamed protein product [Hermetia illucens]